MYVYKICKMKQRDMLRYGLMLNGIDRSHWTSPAGRGRQGYERSMGMTSM